MRALAHGWVEPADIYVNDPISAKIRLHEANQPFVDANVQRLSPLGVDVFVDAKQFKLGALNCEMEVQLTLAGQKLAVRANLANRSATVAGRVLLALRFASSQFEQVSNSHDSGDVQSMNLAVPRLWDCSTEFFPTAMGLNPARYNDYLYFKVVAMSAQGMRLVCSQRHKMLLPGLQLKLQMSLPMVGEACVDVRVDRVSVHADERKRLFDIAVTVLSLETYAREMIAQYLIQFGHVESLDALRADGLNPPSVARGVDFYFVTSRQDHADVLKLRLLAHRQFGNLRRRDVCAKDLDDAADESARILVGKHKGRTVASARFRFVQKDQPLVMEAHRRCFEELPPREQIVEISRACTDPEYRRGNLFANVVHQLLVSSIPVGRPYVLFVSLSNLLSFYKSIGCRALGLTQQDDLWEGEQHLLLMNGINVCLGRDVGPVVWNLMFRKPYEYLLARGVIRPTLLDRLRLAGYRGIGLVTDVWFWLFRPKISV